MRNSGKKTTAVGQTRTVKNVMGKTANKSETFWQKLSKPVFVLAPMANVTDSVFRKLIAKYGRPDVIWTEFVSADGLMSLGRENLLNDLIYSNKERPIVAQLFTGHPEVMRKAARLIAELGFDGLDINMGCPDRAVEKQSGGAALIKQPKLAIEVIQSARAGIAEHFSSQIDKAADLKSNNLIKRSVPINPNRIPVSVKTRLGYNKVDLEWIKLLMEQKLPALTIHLRTRKEMSDVPAHWEVMPAIIKMRDEIQVDIKPKERTLIIGNGDVETIESGKQMVAKYGCDGVMIGRGIFGKPWLFNDLRAKRAGTAKMQHMKSVGKSDSFDYVEKTGSDRTPAERLKVLLEHTKLFENTYCKPGKHIKNFAVMKKHFKAYVSGWDGAKELRAKLMETENFNDVKKIIDEYLLITELAKN